MVLYGVRGNRKAVDHALLCYAIENTPSIVVDCANVANIHRFFPLYPNADFNQVYVYEFELLYKFRDALLALRNAAIQRNVHIIVITSMNHLFHYQNPTENAEVYNHIWELLAILGSEFEVRVALDESQVSLAKRFGAEVVMGHVVSSQRQNLEHMIAELERYGKALRKEERETWHDILRVPLRHVGSVAAANSLHAWSFLVLTVVLEQEKRIRELEKHAGISYRRISHEEQHRLVAENL